MLGTASDSDNEDRYSLSGDLQGEPLSEYDEQEEAPEIIVYQVCSQHCTFVKENRPLLMRHCLCSQHCTFVNGKIDHY